MKKMMMKSRFGRMLRRVLGEEAGAVMMEYVIVAVLIAAAAVIAVAVFGKTLVGMFSVGAEGMTGKGNNATTIQQSVQQNKQDGFNEAGQTADKFSDAATATKTN